MGGSKAVCVSFHKTNVWYGTGEKELSPFSSAPCPLAKQISACTLWPIRPRPSFHAGACCFISGIVAPLPFIYNTMGGRSPANAPQKKSTPAPQPTPSIARSLSRPSAAARPSRRWPRSPNRRCWPWRRGGCGHPSRTSSPRSCGPGGNGIAVAVVVIVSRCDCVGCKRKASARTTAINRNPDSGRMDGFFLITLK